MECSQNLVGKQANQAYYHYTRHNFRCFDVALADQITNPKPESAATISAITNMSSTIPK